MSVHLTVPENSWLLLPKTFPTPAGETAEQWEERIIAGMRDAWDGRLDDVQEPAVRDALRHGLERVLPEDSIALQYWPAASVVNAIVHVVAVQVGADGPRQVIPVDEGPFDVPPVTDLFETEKLGAGVEARYLSTIDTQPPLSLGSLNYLFENSEGFVFVGIDATLPRLVGIMLEPLREIVRSIEILDDEGNGPWERCTVDTSRLSRRGEDWNFETQPEPVAG